MPIEVATNIQNFDQETFHELDRKLMRIVFDVHNEFGRFLNEALYKQEIATRWESSSVGTIEREVRKLLVDWGAFLEITLYRDALVSFLGGAEQVLRPVPVRSGNRIIGQQLVHLLTEDTAFALSAVTVNPASMEDHQQRFLNHTPLRNIQWINCNQQKIEFRTLTK